jgi:glutathione S-transferase
MIVYGTGLSPFVRKARIAIAEVASPFVSAKD